LQVGDIGYTNCSTRFEEHPTNVRIEETLVSVVGIQIGVGVAMMSSVTSSPPFDGTFNSSGPA